MSQNLKPNWEKLKGGYRLPYDPRIAVDKIRLDPLDKDAWSELWNELHHQGDVDVASYATVPLLVEACRTGPRDWNFYGLISVIEVERNGIRNPNVPNWLSDNYNAALQQAKTYALSDLAKTNEILLIRSAMALISLTSGYRELGALLMHLDTSEISSLLDEWLSWSEQYRHEDS